LKAVWGERRDSVFAVGQGGTVIHWNGSSWRGLDAGTDEDLWAVWGSGAGDVRVFGRNGVILRGRTR
jgi:hypothetical protein